MAVATALLYNSAAFAYDAAAEHVLRAVVYSQAVSDGALLPRWVQELHWGLGSPLFTFQGPLPYALLDGLFRLGIEHPIGWRILIAAGLLAAFVGAFLLTLELTGRRWPAFLAAVAFLYAPYVLRNALERGSNEAFSMFLYPWVLWSLLWLARRPGVGRFSLAVLLWSMAIASHVLAPLLLAPFAFLLAAGLAWRWRTAAPLLALLTGVLLTALLWAPMLSEQANVHVERNFGTPEGNPITGALPLDRLLAPPAIYDTARDANQTGVRMGLLHAALLALGLPGALLAWRQGRRQLAMALAVAAGAGLFITWMLTRRVRSLVATAGTAALSRAIPHPSDGTPGAVHRRHGWSAGQPAAGQAPDAGRTGVGHRAGGRGRALAVCGAATALRGVWQSRQPGRGARG